mgnify:CR=1 FL=1
MRQGCMLLSVFCLIGIIACSGEEGHDIQIPDPVICTLNYTIPDTEIPDTRASDTGGKISVARPEESAIKDVKLLFFIYDEHGNGLYAGSLDGTVDGNHLAKTGKISVTIPGSGSIDNHTDWYLPMLRSIFPEWIGMPIVPDRLKMRYGYDSGERCRCIHQRTGPIRLRTTVCP